MNLKFIRAAAVALLLSASQFVMAESSLSLIVVEKDGNSFELPITNVERVDFDTFNFSVRSKEGNSEKFDYDKVSRIDFSSMTTVAKLTKEARLLVWPSVATTDINVAGTDAVDVINIYSLNGTRVISQKAEEGKNTLDVSRLRSGEYILTAGSTSVKFIKK